MKIVKRVSQIVGVYLVAWTISYSIMMGFDFRFYFEYLILAWSNPGERPIFIQMISLLITVIVVITYFVLSKRNSFKDQK